jgi:hypothetical protein
MGAQRRRRRLALLRAGYGLVLLGVPRLLPGRSRALRLAAGALGVRQLTEAALTARGTHPRRLHVAAALDATHAASMVVLALLRPDRRMLAAVNGVTAALLAAAAERAAGAPT